MKVRLEYDKTGAEIELPDHLRTTVLESRFARELDDPHAALSEAIRHPIGCASLEELARGKRSAAISVCDITRPAPNKLVLPHVTAALERAGIQPENIRILIATGLHREATPAELDEILGQEILSRYWVDSHRARNLDEQADLGVTSGGTHAYVDRRFVETDLHITLGFVEPHLMAGFSGGRKLVCPGLAGLETIKVWHGPDFLEHPKADCGILDGNPVHEENTWIARHTGCDFIVNVVIDAQRRPLQFVAGDMEQAFLEGVEFCKSVVVDTVAEPVDIVVTSSAGYPLDTTFYQAVKGLSGALPIVKQGGTIIMAAGLAEGIGSPEFRRLFDETPNLEVFVERIRGQEYWVLDQWQLEELAKVRRKAKVKLVSDGLPPATIDKLFVESAESVEQAVADSLAEYGPTAKIAVIPKGPYVLAQVG